LKIRLKNSFLSLSWKIHNSCFIIFLKRPILNLKFPLILVIIEDLTLQVDVEKTVQLSQKLYHDQCSGIQPIGNVLGLFEK
jgi:hypothetical protein